MAQADFDSALKILQAGGLVALPTETVYGLAADAENELAVRRIFAVKGRPQTHPVIVHLASFDPRSGWVRDVSEDAKRLAERFWPGPMTLILPRGPRVLDVVTGGQDTVGIRVPRHPIGRELLRRFGGGLAAPSANRFGHVSPTRAEHVQADLGGQVDLILDGGPCEVGVESTIVDVSTSAPAILRPGAISSQELEEALGRPVPLRTHSEVRAPGTLASHYAPRAGVVLCGAAELPRELESKAGARVVVISPASVAVPSAIPRFTLPDDPPGFARELYASLRRVDEQGFDLAVVVPPASEEGVGLAILDRLRRAAHR